MREFAKGEIPDEGGLPVPQEKHNPTGNIYSRYQVLPHPVLSIPYPQLDTTLPS